MKILHYKTFVQNPCKSQAISLMSSGLLYFTLSIYGLMVNIGGVLLLNIIDISTVAIIFCWFGPGRVHLEIVFTNYKK